MSNISNTTKSDTMESIRKNNHLDVLMLESLCNKERKKCDTLILSQEWCELDVSKSAELFDAQKPVEALRIHICLRNGKKKADLLNAFDHLEKQIRKDVAVHVKMPNDGQHLFTGVYGVHGVIKAWYIYDSNVECAGEIGPLVSGIRDFTVVYTKSVINESCCTESWFYTLAAVERYGGITIWDVEIHKLATTAEQHLKSRLREEDAILSASLSRYSTGCASIIEFLQDNETLFYASYLPFQNPCFLNSTTGQIVGTIDPLSCSLPWVAPRNIHGRMCNRAQKGRKIILFDFTCSVMDPVPSKFYSDSSALVGHWVALSNTQGMLVLIFIPNTVLDALKLSSTVRSLTREDIPAKVCSAMLETVDITFCSHHPNTSSPPRVTLLSKDGWLREWSGATKKLKIAVADPNPSREARFLCQGGFHCDSKNVQGDSHSSILIASNTKAAPLLRYSLPESLEETKSAGVLLCWTCFSLADHSQRRPTVVFSFLSPITGMVHNKEKSTLVVLTQDGALSIFRIGRQTDTATTCETATQREDSEQTTVRQHGEKRNRNQYVVDKEH